MRCLGTLLGVTCALTLTWAALAQDAELLLSVDFTKDYPSLRIHAKGTFDGPLPQDCAADFPTWNTSIAESESMSDGGRRFIRINVKRLDQAVQLAFTKTKIPQGYYKLLLETRSPRGMNVNIRQAGVPYESFWNEDVKPSAEWQTYTLFAQVSSADTVRMGGNMRIKADPSDLRLYLLLRDGVTDIASLKLLPVTAKERAEIEARAQAVKDARIAAEEAMRVRPSEDCPNYIRNSRFPLGMPSGWSITRDVNPGEFSVSSDESCIGPSGVPSLKVTGTRIRSETFNVPASKRNGKFAVSFAYMAERNFHVSVVETAMDQKNRAVAEKSLASKIINRSDTWKTETLEFDAPGENSKCLSISFADAGVLHLDSLRASPASDSRQYRSAGECEIALAPVASTLSQERVQFSDEPSLIRYCATGDMRNATLKTKVFDLRGQEKQGADISLEKSPNGSFDYALFQDAPLGQFRIEAWVERDGKIISPFNELVVTRVRRPVFWNADAPSSPFGAHFLPQKARALKGAGINWARFHDAGMEYIDWAYLEPEKGKWNFHDKEISFYRDARIKLIGHLSTTPLWASYFDGIQRPPYFNFFCQPRNLDDYANYVRTVVSRYKGIIDEYIIWNEPSYNGAGDDSLYWHKTFDKANMHAGKNPEGAREFVELSKVAYTAAKAVDPSVSIVGINGANETWVKKLEKDGAYDFCDYADFHWYSDTIVGYPGDWFDISFLNGGAAAMAYTIAKSKGKPFIHSEGGPKQENGTFSNDGAGIYRCSIAWKPQGDPLEASDIECRYVMRLLCIGVKQVVLYSEHCYEALPRTPTFAVLLGSDGFPTPAYAAFSNMAWLLEGRQFKTCVKINNDVCVYVFDGRGGSVAVVSGRKNASCSIPSSKDFTALDLFGNPLASGAKYEGRLLYLTSDLPAMDLAAKLEIIVSSGGVSK